MIEKAKTEVKKAEEVKWGPWAAVIVGAAAFLAAQVIAAVIVGIYPIARGWSTQHADNWLSSSVIGLFWLTLVLEVLVVVFIFLFLKHRKTGPKALGLKGSPGVSDLGWAVIGFCVYFVVSAGAVYLAHHSISSLNISEKQQLGFSTSTSGNGLILVFLSLVIFPPIAEEILFRGFLYTGLRTKLPKLVAALITSLIFASLHLIEGTNGLLWVAGIDIFILSLVLVAVREITGKLWASIAIHMTKNLVAFLALFVYHTN